MSHRRGRAVAAGLAVILLPAAILAPSPGFRSPLVSRLFDAGHALVFGAVAIAALVLVRSLRPGWRNSTHLLAAAAVGFGTGVLVEVVQFFGPRDADILDVVRNTLGVAAFLLAAVGASGRGVSRWVPAMAGIVLLGTAFGPVLALAAARVHRSAEFPTLACFDSPYERPLFSTHGGVDVSYPSSPAAWAGRGEGPVCRLAFHAGNYPGFTLNDVVRDWTGYRTLVFEVYSEEPETRRLWLRVEDLEHNQAYEDRYNAMFPIPPGSLTVRVPLEEIRNAPRTRPMDLTAMRGMTFFADHPEPQPYTLYLDDVRLEP